MALVGLLRNFRVAKRFALPEPASTTQERAHVLLGSRRRGPHRPTLPHGPRKCARTQSKPSNSDAAPGESARDSGGDKSNVPPHGALGCLALTTATLVASAPTSTSGDGRLGDGGRGATKRRCEAVCIKESVPFVVGVGRRLRGTRGPQRPGRRVLRARRRQQMAASRLKRRGERERREKGAAGEAGLVGSSWWPSP